MKTNFEKGLILQSHCETQYCKMLIKKNLTKEALFYFDKAQNVKFEMSG